MAVDIATASAQRAFELSLQAVNGAATHQLTGGPGGIDEQLYVRLRREPPPPGVAAPRFAPLASGYATLADRTLELIGVDPLASARTRRRHRGSRHRHDRGCAIRATGSPRPGAVVLSAAVATQLKLAPGQSFELEVDGVRHRALPGRHGRRGAAGLDGIILTDIAQAQEWLGATGRLSRIDVRVPRGHARARWHWRSLRALLPADVEVHESRAEARETFAMTDAFITNLKAMSLLALLVGTFLIYGAVSFAVLQRRTLIGVLRALGVTRAQVLRLILGEALLLGVVGAACGCLLGLAIGRALLGLVSQTINDLYFVVAVNSVALPAAHPREGGGRRHRDGSCRRAGTRRSRSPAGCRSWGWRARSSSSARAPSPAASCSPGCCSRALAALVIAVSGHSLLARLRRLVPGAAGRGGGHPGAAAGAGAGRGAGVRAQQRGGAAGAAGHRRLLSRTGVAVAALGMALTAMIGVAVMVESFRESLREWLVQSMHADIYVSAPGPSGNIARRLDPAVVRSLLATPGVRAHSEARHAVVGFHARGDRAERAAPGARQRRRLPPHAG